MGAGDTWWACAYVPGRCVRGRPAATSASRPASTHGLRKSGLTVVFAALAVAREAQNRTGLAIGNLIRQLRPLRSATIAINGTTQTFQPVIPQPQQAILDALRAPGGSHALNE